MAITAAQVRARMNASTDTLSDDSINSALSATAALIEKYAGTAFDDIPIGIIDRATLLVACEMCTQDESPNGILNQQYDFSDGVASAPIRIGRDPMTAARPLLDPYVSGRYFCS